MLAVGGSRRARGLWLQAGSGHLCGLLRRVCGWFLRWLLGWSLRRFFGRRVDAEEVRLYEYPDLPVGVAGTVHVQRELLARVSDTLEPILTLSVESGAHTVRCLTEERLVMLRALNVVQARTEWERRRRRRLVSWVSRRHDAGSLTW